MFLISSVVGFGIQPYVMACLIGCYTLVLNSSSYSLRDFIGFGRRYFKKFLTVALIHAGILYIYMSIVLFIPSPLLNLNQELVKLGSFLLTLILIPLSFFTPIYIVLNDVQPMRQAIIETYILVLRTYKEFLPFLFFFWVMPSVIYWMIWGGWPVSLFEKSMSSLVTALVQLLALPTMVIYLSKQTIPLEYRTTSS